MASSNPLNHNELSNYQIWMVTMGSEHESDKRKSSLHAYFLVGFYQSSARDVPFHLAACNLLNGRLY